MSFITLTNHSRQQAISRYCLREKDLLRLAELSVTQGYSINDAPRPKIRRFLKRKARNGSKVYVWTGYVFVFTPDFLLITTFRIPKYFLR